MIITNPVIVEFAGLPRSGKTTAARGLKMYMESRGEKVCIVEERADRCPIQDKLDPSFNLWTAFSFLCEFLIARERGMQCIIADRGLFDAAVWVELLNHEGKHQKEYETFRRIEKLPILQRVERRTFFLFCDVETALRREFERTLVKQQGRIMNRKMLHAYMETYRSLSRTRTPFLEIDTSKMQIADMLSVVYTKFEGS